MELSYASRTLAGQWVYHKTLEEDHPDLYQHAKAALSKIEFNDELSIAAANCRSLGMQERVKELALLQEVFGTTIGLDPEDPNFHTELIKGINYALSTKEILERSIARIKTGKKQIGLGALVVGYVITAMNRLLETEDPAEKIKQLMTNNKKLNFADAAEKVLDPIIEKAIDLGIRDALNSADFRGGEDHAFTELIAYLNQASGNVFISRLKQIWKLDEIKDSIIQQMKHVKTKKRNESIKKSFKTGMEKDKWSRGGLTAEAIEEFVINSLAQSKSGTYHIEAKGTGATGIKADTIVGFDIDMTQVANFLDEQLNGAVTRERNVRVLTELSNRLSKIDRGFIVYSNAKNYSLSKKFSGFSGGEPISLSTFSNMFSTSRTNMREFIGAIANVIPGAIGEDYKETIVHLIAVDVANLLFDDVETFGAQSGGARAIHLLYLNGIYIPLSFLLLQIADAIDSTAHNADSVVKVTVNAPGSLLFTYPDNTGYENWVAQRSKAQNNITISIRFLTKFKSVIDSLFQ